MKWNKVNQPQQTQLGCLLIWTKFYNVPPNYWTAKGLSHIASIVGEPLYADEATESRIKLKFAQICTNIDLSKPIKQDVQLRMNDLSLVEIRIEYQWLPKICSKCKALNHSEANCPLTYINHPHRKGVVSNDQDLLPPKTRITAL
ncbi:uncharacterized protein LOC132272505 [Cornus florida]|uniref:uncharacterized protein LOC132272505 n=1 Tax=Cornus florida TaxID=4283 RepID=UPI00289B393E|nr:uncharacterized protein LOC132272505 [Cornus florida]